MSTSLIIMPYTALPTAPASRVGFNTALASGPTCYFEDDFRSGSSTSKDLTAHTPHGWGSVTMKHTNPAFL